MLSDRARRSPQDGPHPQLRRAPPPRRAVSLLGAVGEDSPFSLFPVAHWARRRLLHSTRRERRPVHPWSRREEPGERSSRLLLPRESRSDEAVHRTVSRVLDPSTSRSRGRAGHGDSFTRRRRSPVLLAGALAEAGPPARLVGLRRHTELVSGTLVNDALGRRRVPCCFARRAAVGRSSGGVVGAVGWCCRLHCSTS